MMTRHYKVAGHTFTVSGKDELFEQMGNYEPFECEGGERIGRRKAGGGQSSTVILLWETKCLNIWRERGQRVV